MDDSQKTREQLIAELQALRQQLAGASAVSPTDEPAAMLMRRQPAPALVVLDIEGRVLIWSSGAEQLFGWREDEVIGKPHPIIQPDAAREFRETFEAHLRGENCCNAPRRRQRKDGTLVDINLSTAPLRDNTGQMIGVVGLMTPADEQLAFPTPGRAATSKDLLASAYDGVWMINAEGRTIFVNERMARMLGYSPAEMMGRPLVEFVQPKDRAYFEQVLERRARGVAEAYEYCFPRRDRGEVWTHISATPVYDDGGRYAGAMALVTDISEHKQLEAMLEQRVQQRTAELTRANENLQKEIRARQKAEHALRRSESLYRLLAEHATDMISRHDLEGRFLFASPASRQLLLYEPEELVGKHPYQELFQEEDIPRIRAAHEQIAQTREPVSVAYRIRRKDERYVWFESTCRAVQDSRTGEIQEVVCVSRDVTERRQAEERLRLVLSAVDQIEEAVVITEANLDEPGPRIVYVNAAFTQMTGYSAEEVIGRTPRILQGEQTDWAVLDRLREQLSRGESFAGETANYRKDGSEFILAWHIAPVRDEHGRLTHWVAIQRDVTEEKRAEELARQRQAELAHVARLSTMGEMASELAHELNQPLAAIGNYVQGALRRLQADTGEGETSQLKEALELASAQAQRAGTIVRRLRHFVRKREPRHSTVEVNALVNEVLMLMEPEIRNHRVRLQRQLAEDLPTVIADSVQIEQVLLNVARNAVEAMAQQPEAERVLTVRTHPGEGEQVHVTIHDTGPGVSRQEMDQLFEPFFTTKSQGMGMGLAISHSIVEAHEGELWAETNAAGGMSFHLLLPRGPSQPRSSEPGKAD